MKTVRSEISLLAGKLHLTGAFDGTTPIDITLTQSSAGFNTNPVGHEALPRIIVAMPATDPNNLRITTAGCNVKLVYSDGPGDEGADTFLFAAESATAAVQAAAALQQIITLSAERVTFSGELTAALSRRGAEYEGEIETGSGRKLTVGWTEVAAGTSESSIDVDYVRDAVTGQPIADLNAVEEGFDMDSIVDEVLRGKVAGRRGHT